MEQGTGECLGETSVVDGRPQSCQRAARESHVEPWRKARGLCAEPQRARCRVRRGSYRAEELREKWVRSILDLLTAACSAMTHVPQRNARSLHGAFFQPHGRNCPRNNLMEKPWMKANLHCSCARCSRQVFNCLGSEDPSERA